MKKIKIIWRHQSIGVRDTAKRLIDNEFDLDFRDGKNRSGTNLFQPTDQRTVQLSWPRIDPCAGLRRRPMEMEEALNRISKMIAMTAEMDTTWKGGSYNHTASLISYYLVVYGSDVFCDVIFCPSTCGQNQM